MFLIFSYIKCFLGYHVWHGKYCLYCDAKSGLPNFKNPPPSPSIKKDNAVKVNRIIEYSSWLTEVKNSDEVIFIKSLKPGFYVYPKESLVKVSAEDLKLTINQFNAKFKRVELTPDLYNELKIPIVFSIDNRRDLYIKDRGGVVEAYISEIAEGFPDGSLYLIKPVKYLDEFQALVWSITGKELELKLK